ncbi:MAG: alanine racemase [Pyrinomonadaceae bacterium]
MDQQIPQRPTYARIDLDNLAFNFRSIREFVGNDVRVMAVVKANAYGHGAVACARRLALEGADWFAVATLEESIELRDAGITSDILCMGGFYPGQESAGLSYNIIPAIIEPEQAERVSRAAGSIGAAARVHVKIDTGMGRVGIPHLQASQFADRLSMLPNLQVHGVMTHLAAADDLNQNEFTNAQIERLNAVAEIFRGKGLCPEFVDIANSPGAVGHPLSRGGMVRVGGLLYGLGRDVLPGGVPWPTLKPVLSLHTKLAQVKRVPRGASIGYGREFVTTRESIIGTIPIGYNDGFRRGLSNRGRAIVGGTAVPVAGRVSMDWTTLDLTALPAADVGDDVVLIGAAGNNAIGAADVAEAVGTISYEITCGISQRVPRLYRGIGQNASIPESRLR